MTSANRTRGGGPGQPWTPGAAGTGITCPACGLANDAGARTCRNCGLPIARADDPLRGVAPGRVDLPKVRRSGASATVGFVMVMALLIGGASLAFTGGGGLLSGGGRFFGAPASPTPTPAIVANASPGAEVGPEATTDVFAEPDIKASGTSFDFTCLDGAIRDLSRGSWILSDVQAGVRTEDDGTVFDQVYWKLTRNGNKKVKNPTKVTMQWVEDARELQDRFGIGRVQGDRAILVTFNGPVDITANSTIEASQFDDEGIDQIRRVQLFEKNGKVRTAIGIREDSCARMRSAGWAAKAKGPNARVVLDLERVYEGP